MSGENLRPIGTYREESSFCKRSFELFADKVSIQGQNRQGKFVHHIPLGQLAPDIGTQIQSQGAAKLLTAGFLFIVGIGLTIIAQLASSNLKLLSMMIMTVTLTLSLTNFVQGVWLSRRKLQAYHFLNTQGVKVLDMIEAGPEKENCRAFAELVSQTIKNLRGP